MAVDPVELKIEITPVITGLDDLTEQLRQTGESLIAAADSLQRLPDGSPDASRTRPDSVCPFITLKTVHDAHVIKVTSSAPGTLDTQDVIFECPGHPVRPWHEDGQPDSYRDQPCPKVSAGRVHLPHMMDSDHGRQKRCPGYSG